MNLQSWAEMVKNTRRLEKALGTADKKVAGNEVDTVVIQRRCLRAARDIKKGEVVSREMIDVLRPATRGAILPDQIDFVIGMKINKNVPFGKELTWGDLES
jgi:sialic acid synthase SpsE